MSSDKFFRGSRVATLSRYGRLRPRRRKVVSISAFEAGRNKGERPGRTTAATLRPNVSSSRRAVPLELVNYGIGPGQATMKEQASRPERSIAARLWHYPVHKIMNR